jgi:urea transport system permease protein
VAGHGSLRSSRALPVLRACACLLALLLLRGAVAADAGAAGAVAGGAAAGGAVAGGAVTGGAGAADAGAARTPVGGPVPAAAASGATAPGVSSAGATAADDPLNADLSALATADYSQKSEIIGKLIALRRPRTKELLSALLEGSLYTRQRDGKVFIVAPAAAAPDTQFALTDPLTGNSARGTEAIDGFDKIRINNALRTVLRTAIARFDLDNPDASVRKAAVAEILHSLDAPGVALLGERLRVERDPGVKAEIQTGIALAELDSDQKPQRLAAIDRLSGSLNPDVYNRLATLADPASEPDASVRGVAAAALRHIDSWRKFYGAVQTLFFGLGLGSVLVLSAIGLAITFGVMGVINMAHGELMMLGAYTTYVMQLLLPNHIGTSIIVAIPAAFLVSGLMGVLIERGIVRFLYGRPLETLLATFGVSLILQQLVRDVFSANNRPVEAPSWLTGSLQINEALSITYNRLATVLFTLLLFGILLLVLKRTRLGLEVRAVAQNRSMAKAMGVPTEWVDALTFGLGSGIAGVAGVALSQLTNVGPNLGQSYIVDSFMVVVFGGVGNLWGTLIGGMSLGVLNQILEPFAGAVLGKIVVLVCLILFIQWRPRGLFPQKGRSAEA